MDNSSVVDTTAVVSFMVQVESPNEARAYGTGELIVIDVVFDQKVVLDGQPALLLETGVFNQEVRAIRSIGLSRDNL